MPPRGTFRKFSRPSIGAGPWAQGKIGTPAGLASWSDDATITPTNDLGPATAVGQVYALPIRIAFFVSCNPQFLLLLAHPIVYEMETMPQPKPLTTGHLPSPRRIERTLTRAAKILGDMADLAESPDTQITQVTFDQLVLIEARLDVLELDIGMLIQPQNKRAAQDTVAPLVLTDPVVHHQKFGIEDVLAKISAANAPQAS